MADEPTIKFPEDFEMKESPEYNDLVPIYDTTTGKSKKTSLEKIMAQTQASIIGTATPSSSPTGEETNGQSYRVSNTTDEDQVFTNFDVTVPAKTWGLITKDQSGAWAYVESPESIAGLVPSGDYEGTGADLKSDADAAYKAASDVDAKSVKTDAIGFFNYKAGQSMITLLANGAADDATLYDIGYFYDKRNGQKLAGSGFLASKTLTPIKGGKTYNYKFRLYNYASVSFFDKDGVFVQAIGPDTEDSTWTDLEGSITLPENVTQVGYTLPKSDTVGRTDLFIKPTEDLIIATDKEYTPSGTAVLKSEKTNEIIATGAQQNVTTESAVIKYAPSFDFLGITKIEAGQSMITLLANGAADDATLYDIGYFYDKRNGQKLAGSGFLASKTLTPIKGGKTYNYYIELYGYASISFFTESGNFVQSIASPTDDSTWVALEGSITLPENVTKAGFSFSKSNDARRALSTFSPTESITEVTDKVFALPGSGGGGDYYPKNTGKVMSLGDSTVEFGTWPQQMGDILGYTTLNCGVGGTRMAYHESSVYGALSFYKIAEAINTGNFTAVNNALDSLIADADVSYPSKAARLRAAKASLNDTDYSTIDIITVSFGTNDFTGENPIGDILSSNKDTTTLVGALNYGIEKILTAYPLIKIVVTTPTFRFVGDSPTWESSDTYTNTNGDKLIEFCDGIEGMASLNHTPCKNLYKGGWFNELNHASLFINGPHFNDLGYTQMAQMIAGFIKSHLF